MTTQKPLITADLWHCEHRVNGIGHPACWARYVSSYGSKEMRIGYLDLECNGLKGDFNWIYGYYIKERGKNNFLHHYMQVPRDIVTKTFDRKVNEHLIEDMRKFDLIVTYYGSGFDIPMSRTRALYWGLDYPPYGLVQHLDLYYTVRYKLLLHSNRLGAAAELLGVEEKTPLKPSVWQNAMADQKAMDYIEEHNKQDVIVLEQVHNKLLKFFRGARKSI